MRPPNPWKILHRDFPDVMLDRRGHSERGRYYNAIRGITTRRGLLLVEERSTLWHELVHARRLDECVDDLPGETSKQELSCWREAARLALPIELLEWAIPRSHTDDELADLCKVTVELLSIRERSLHPVERHHLRAIGWARDEGVA